MSDDMIRRGDAIAALEARASAKSASGLVLPLDAAKNALRAIPAVQVGVKPLEWDTFSTECARAFTVAGRYEVFWGSRSGQVCLDMRGRTTWHCGIEAAKAAAQADYEARIRPALTVQLGKEVMPDDQGNTHSRLDTSPGVTAAALLADALHDMKAHIGDQEALPHDGQIKTLRKIDAALARLKGGEA